MRFNSQVTTERFDRRFCKIVCCCGAPILFACAVLALDHLGATPVEFLIGLLAAAAAALGMIVVGCVGGPKHQH
jgi:hypothetical protein